MARDSSGIGVKGHCEPCSKMFLMWFQFGWNLNRAKRVEVDRNSDPYPIGDPCCATIAECRLRPYLVRMQ